LSPNKTVSSFPLSREVKLAEDSGHKWDEEKHNQDSRGRSQAEITVGEGSLVDVDAHCLRRGSGATTGHDVDKVKGPKRIEKPQQKDDEQGWLEDGQGDAEQGLPSARSIDRGRFE